MIIQLMDFNGSRNLALSMLYNVIPIGLIIFHRLNLNSLAGNFERAG